jgi:pyruvate dehydrogenase E1 component alpha subunit
LPDKDTLLEMYRRMVRIRTFEEEANYLFLQGKIPGTLHQYDGQEAVAVGTCMHLNVGDFITSTHRPHGHSIAKGVDTRKIMAELFGRDTGCCRGKGGSMHICDMSVGVIPAIAIVGGGIPVAAGLALSFKMRKMDNVVACFFGEGASSQGAFHEGVNLSALWKLPVVFICENNLYAASTHVSKALPVEGVAPRASSYGIPGTVVDGNDVLAVFDAVGRAVGDARTGKGPTLVECRTYRRRGHSRSDPGNYRPREEVEAWLEKDPINRLGRQLLEEGTATQAELDEIGNSISGEIQEAIRFSEESPFPDPSLAYEDVFTGM